MTRDEFFELLVSFIAVSAIFLLVGWWLWPLSWLCDKLGDGLWWAVCKLWPSTFKRDI